MFNAIRKVLKGDKGFTLIELLVVVAIIGILVAIAIPQFSNYKKQANDSAAESDIRNLALSMEAYYASNNAYPATGSIAATGTVDPTSAIGSAGFKKTNNVAVVWTPNTAVTPPTFTLTATHSGGSNKTYTWNSQSGGLVN